MPNKIVPIKYTSRDFNSIKQDLIEHAKRYYPDNYKDFNEGSFASLMVDTVAYVGDILSFYLDYQANESFLDTASEYNNILKIAKQLGYKHSNAKSSTCIATFYLAVPSAYANVNSDYLPVLKKGSTFSTNNRTRFILTEDVRFDNPDLSRVPNTIAQSRGSPLTWGIKAHGRVVSGVVKTETISVGSYEKFKKIKLSEPNIVEIMSVYDTEGNQYYEVDYLTQNTIYKSITNKDTDSSKLAKEILKPFIAPRRFTLEKDIDAAYLQFGGTSDVVIENNSMAADPGNVVFQMHGKDYISSDYFDPSVILNNDKYGIAPSNTDLTVTYRYSDRTTNINFGTNSLVNVENAIFFFDKENLLDAGLLSSVKASLELTNESPIVGSVSDLTVDEMKIRIKNSFSAQSRAVTSQDYKALCYLMPTKYGSIKRVNVYRDDDSAKRNLNIYVLCENQEGKLAQANLTVKNNLKTWLSRNKMINDSIDILDGKIVNYGIQFVALGVPGVSKYDILAQAIEQLKDDFMILPEFGEPMMISSIYNSLRKVTNILDIKSVDIVPKINGVYSSSTFNFNNNMSKDERYIKVPLNVVMELKYPDVDIKGTIL